MIRFAYRAISGALYMLLHAVVFLVQIVDCVIGLFVPWNSHWWFRECLAGIWEFVWRIVVAILAIFWFPWQERLDYPFFSADENPPTFRYIIFNEK